jgi:protein-arginine kinase activator protein McsA
MTEKKEQKAKEENLQRCNKCNSTFTYIRIRDRQRVCRNCGNVEDLKEVSK